MNDPIAEGLADFHGAVELGTESAVHVADQATPVSSITLIIF